MRIVGGQWGGRTLVAPPGQVTRPTTDSLRESLFNILQHGVGHEPGRVLDLFSGTGALAFEALSRGAGAAVLIEADAKALASIRKNKEALGLGSDVIHVIDSPRLEGWGKSLKQLGGVFTPFDTVFCDPPYEKGLVTRSLNFLEKAEFPVAAGACLIVEISSREKTPALPAWELIEERRRGTTALLFYRRRG